MSRIGRAPITIPAGVEVTKQGTVVTVKGPKGTLQRDIGKDINVTIENNQVLLTRNSDDKEIRSKHGLYRALIRNMVEGVTKGFSRSLIINGVGYKAQVSGEKLVMNIGYSHPVEIVPPKGISFACPTPTEITVSGIDKELVGQIAANIKATRQIEPYHGYGVRYKEDVVILKEGKKAGK
jgi:large subunit ribosomal protein L6